MLDPTFGSGGKVTTDVGTGDDVANAVATTPNFVVAAGSSGSGTSHDFAVAVYNASGQPVSGFGGTGHVTTDFGGDDVANAVAIQGTKILVAGTTTTSDGSDFALARYNMNGTLDATFSGDGKVTTDVAGDFDGAYALLVQGDKAVAGGFTLSGHVADFALVRYNADGTPDNTFGNHGRTGTDFFGDFDTVRGLVAGPYGTVVAAGYATTPDSDTDFALASFNPNGHLSSWFGTSGRVTTSFAGEDAAQAITHDGNKLVVAGFTFGTTTNQDFAVARYTVTGALDSTFDGDGKVTTDFGQNADAATGVVAGSGAITVGGRTLLGTTEYFGLARYDEQGALVDSWGTHGRTATQFGSDTQRSTGLAAQGDKTVAVGWTGSTDGMKFALARYLAS